jgi:hypothetical protein
VQLSPFSCYFIPLWSKYSSENPVLKHLSLCSSLNVRDQVSHPYKTHIIIIIITIKTTNLQFCYEMLSL